MAEKGHKLALGHPRASSRPGDPAPAAAAMIEAPLIEPTTPSDAEPTFTSPDPRPLPPTTTAARLLRSCAENLKTLVGIAQITVLIVILQPTFIGPLASFVFAPPILLGFFSSESAVGVPPAFDAWHRLPYLIPMVLFWYLPFAVVFTFSAGVSMLIALSLRWIFAVYPLCRRASWFPNREPALPDTESGLHDREGPPSTRPRSDINDEARYREHASIWAALEGDDDKVRPGDVRLISLNWLVALAERGGVLPRRQDLPEEAFLSAAQLRRIEQGARRGYYAAGNQEAHKRYSKESSISSMTAWMRSFFGRKRNPDGLLPIVSVSYCWLESAHPDREGRQLQLLSRKLRGLYGGRGLLGACRDYGFSDMGVFWDWASGYQRNPALFAPRGSYEREAYEASRSAEQKAAFGRMLHNTMDLWYAHAAVTVVLLTQLPDELPAGFDRSRTYDTRGWTTFERCSAELGAKTATLGFARWKLVIDVANEDGRAQQRLPATPERMAKLLAACRFTNGSDSAAVLALYKKTAKAVLGQTEELNYLGMPLVRGDAWTSPALLGAALNYCESVQTIIISGTRLDDEGVAELAAGLEDGALPALEQLELAGNRFGARGVDALYDAFSRGVAPRLQVLAVYATPIGDDGAAALATAMATGEWAHALRMAFCDVGDEGALALAAALPAAAEGCSVYVVWNRIGIAGQVALLKALDARRGPRPDHFFELWQLCLLPWSALFNRAWRRGVRRMLESGRPT